MARGVALAVALVATLALTACDTTTSVSDGRIKVVASTDVWGSVASAVGGNAVDVTAIIHNPSQDPHDYQTTPSDAARINAAKLAVYNGDGYDDFFAADLRATPSSGRRTIVAFDLSGKPADGSNEHIFYDLPTVAKVADAVAHQLGQLRPALATMFAGNAAAFDRGVRELTSAARQIGVTHPGRKVVVTEPVADYLLRAAGITDATPPAFERAVESDTDIPVAAINDANDLITTRQVAALVNNAQAVTNVTGELAAKARSAGVPVVDVTETLPPGVTGYLTWMSRQINDLATAIGT
jgi:zinc/manganese transport system substrate-binding protein